jgi:tripartite-type tricarboxylate transporter receptor subunit TctC
MKTGTIARGFVAAIALAISASAVFAQDYPAKPVRLIVSFPPGGGADIVARVLAPHFPEQLGQSLVIDNRAGGSGIIGLELGAKAAPDGYTLLIGITGTLAINPSLFPKLPYDPIRDFTPVSMVAVGPNILVAHPSLPVQSVKDLIALAKQRPGTLSYASSGTGGAPHLAGELFKYMAKVDIVHVPYKGAAPATTDVLGGHVPLMFAGMGAAMPYIKTGKLRPLGVAGPKRSGQLPGVPAIAEFLPGFSAQTWFGILGPRGLNPAITARLSTAIRTIASRQDVREQLQVGGYEVLLMSPSEFGAYIAAEIRKWAGVIRSSGIKAE